MHKSRILFAAVLIAVTATAHAQTAANYPNKPLRVIIPSAPGGSSSTVMRIFSDKFEKDVGQPIILDNRPGGNSTIGTVAVARAAPDGYTVLSISNTLTANHWTLPNLPYDTTRDLVGVSTLIRDQDLLAIHASVPANNLKELIAHLKQNPGKLNARTGGAGGITHIGLTLLMDVSGTNFPMIAYKGSGQAVADLLAGRVHISLSSPANLISHIKAGKLKGIAVAGDKRLPNLPDVPTFAEGGLKEFTAGVNWIMLLAPSKTPRDIVEKLNGFIGKAQAAKDVQEAMAKVGMDPFPNSVAATSAVLRAELETFGRIVKQYNIKADLES